MKRTTRLPRSVVALGVVSLLMDASSEAIHSVLPVFVTTTLGVGATWVGLIDGIGRAFALTVRWIAGGASDRSGRRLPWIVTGYGLAAAAKPLFGIAPGVGWVVAARLLDRLGKGLRGAPRDALIAEVASKSRTGTAFGFRQAMDSLGAFLGPLLALGLLQVGLTLRGTMLWSSLPAAACVLVLVALVREPRRTVASTASGFAATPEPDETAANDRAENPADDDATGAGGPSAAIEGEGAATIGPASRGFRILIALAVGLGLARLGEAFLILRAADAGWPRIWLPAVVLIAAAAESAAAWPAGRRADRAGPASPILLGLGALFCSHLLLARTPGSVVAIGVAAALFGLHVGLTEVPLSAWVGRTAPAGHAGGRFGAFGLASGMAALGGGLLAGGLWDTAGPQSAFLAGAVLTILAGPVVVWGAVAVRTGPPGTR